MFEKAIVPLSLASATVMCLALAMVAAIALAAVVLRSARKMATSKDGNVAESGKRARTLSILAIPLSVLLNPVGLFLARRAQRRTNHDLYPSHEEPNPEYEKLGADYRSRARREKTFLPPRTVTVEPDLSFPDRSRSRLFPVALASIIASAACAVATLLTLIFVAPDLILTLSRIFGVEPPETVTQMVEENVASETPGDASAELPDPETLFDEDGHVNRSALFAYLRALDIETSAMEALSDEELDEAARATIDLITADEPTREDTGDSQDTTDETADDETD